MSVTARDRAEFRATVERLFSGAYPAVSYVANDEDVGSTLKNLLQPDAAISPTSSDFGVVHRSTPDAEVYFVANTSNQKRDVRIEFRVTGTLEIWNPMDGQVISTIPAATTSTSTTVELNFEPYQSRVLVFSKRKGTPSFKTRSEAVSTIDLTSDWRVSFGAQQPTVMNRLHSWADDDATRYFSGTATYEKSIDVTNDFLGNGRSVVLDFGEGTPLPVSPITNGMQTWFDPPIREAAVIYINDQRAGSLWAPPYRLDVTSLLKAGRNTIKIIVGNTALNYMAGHRLPDYKLLNLRYGERFQPQDMNKIQVLPSGIIGSPRLTSMK